LEDYLDKMPFSYRGTLHKLLVVLQPDKLSEEDKQRLLAELARASMVVH